MSKLMTVEDRRGGNGEFDELVINNVGMVHVEMMDEQHAYLGFYNGKHMVQMWIGSDGKLSIEHDEDGRRPAPYPAGSVQVRMPTEEEIIAALSPEQLERMREHALCLACHDGNAFDGLIDQYLPDAYQNLWRNGRVGDGEGLPMIYPARAADHWHAFLSPDHVQYRDMTVERRLELVQAFAAWNGRAA